MISDSKSRYRLKKIAFDRNLLISNQSSDSRLKSTEDMKRRVKLRGSHRSLLYRQSSRKNVSPYSTIVVNLEASLKKVSFEKEPNTEGKVIKKKPSMVITLPMKSEKLVAKGTQTDFRESEAQTHPWRHEINADRKLLAELLSMDWFSLEKNIPPGSLEVTLIENNRQKLAWENVIERMRGKKNEIKKKSLVLKLAINELAFREKQKNEENQERLELSKQYMKESREIFEKNLWLKFQKSFICRARENECKILRWNHQLTRKIRKMKFARNHPATKLDIVAIYEDKSSDLYAPKLRDGQNPSLGHEIIDIQCRYLKRFHGLEVLEEHIVDILQHKFSKSRYQSHTCRTEKVIFCLRRFREKVFDEPKEEEFDRLSLKVPVAAPASEPSISRVERPQSYSEEDLYQASLFLKKLLKGRAVQAKKFLEFFKKAP